MPPAASARTHAGQLLAAALALPGVFAGCVPGHAAAQAETEAPAQFSVKILRYQDHQPGLQRVRVTAPAAALQLPLGGRWSIYGSATADSVSGASPRYHSAVSSASRMSDERRGGELRLTRYSSGPAGGPWARLNWTLGAAASTENDYRSRALSLTLRASPEDQNRSWTLGLAGTHDHIGSSDNTDLRESRRTREFSVGLTQVLGPRDIAQMSLTHASGQGYFNDPYKRLDQRPGSRHQSTAVLRWNHHIERGAGALLEGSTLRLSWRAYQDSWGVRAHSLGAEWVFPLATPALTLTPSLRLHTQNAARFYADPVYSFLGAPYPPGYFESPPQHLSLDQRLSAFGAVTVGAKLSVRWDDRWSSDLRLERYEQRGAWRVAGQGSPGLAPFSARIVQWGLSRRF